MKCYQSSLLKRQFHLFSQMRQPFDQYSSLDLKSPSLRSWVICRYGVCLARIVVFWFICHFHRPFSTLTSQLGSRATSALPFHCASICTSLGQGFNGTQWSSPTPWLLLIISHRTDNMISMLLGYTINTGKHLSTIAEFNAHRLISLGLLTT
jgi:hypothetical protein